MTIYELNANFKQGLSLIYAASYGSLQHGVKKLLEKGLIKFRETVQNGRNKKIYQIKDSGRKVFFDWMVAELPLNNLETIILSKIYFLGLIEDKNTIIFMIEEMIKKTESVENNLKMLDSELSELSLPEESLKIAKYQFKTLDYGIMAHSSAIQWLKELLQEIKNET
ncbi:MAG: PadR family transcriptional regulator [Spirochaetales bacterium]|nr:PadR family transcriptional regulator [Spirochaetales bacterium]